MRKRIAHVIIRMVASLMLSCLVVYQPALAQDATPTPVAQVFEVLPLSAEVNQYCEQIIGRRAGLFTSFGSVSKLFGSLMRASHRELIAITPPPGLEEIHETFAGGLEDCAAAADFLEIGIINLGAAEARLALELINSCTGKITVATDQMLAHGTSSALVTDSNTAVVQTATATPYTYTGAHRADPTLISIDRQSLQL